MSFASFFARRRLDLLTALALVAVLLWDATGLDMAVARLSGGAQGFALQDQWFLSSVLHKGARAAAWALVLGLAITAWRPWGPFTRLDPPRRWQLAVTVLVGALFISVVKSASLTSCPWDLSAFGGVARHVSHWALVPDGGPGRCFPAGHASAAFAFLGGYFAFRQAAPAIARRWLLATLAAGLVLGLAQQIRGAHFMSHTLWTGWLCWCVAWALDGLWQWRWPRPAPAL